MMANEIFSHEQRELMKEMELYKAQKEADAKQAEQHELLSKVFQRVMDKLHPPDTDSDSFEDISKERPYKRRKTVSRVDAIPESKPAEQGPAASLSSCNQAPSTAAEESCTTAALRPVLRAGYEAPTGPSPKTKDPQTTEGQIWDFVQDVAHKVH